MDVNDQLFVCSQLTALKHITPPYVLLLSVLWIMLFKWVPPLEELWAGSVERHLMAAKWIHAQIRRRLQTQRSNNSCQRQRGRQKGREKQRGEQKRRERKGTRTGEKYKDVKTNGVCERKMRTNLCGAISQQVRGCLGESRTESDISCEGNLLIATVGIILQVKRLAQIKEGVSMDGIWCDFEFFLLGAIDSYLVPTVSGKCWDLHGQKTYIFAHLPLALNTGVKTAVNLSTL